MAITNTSKLILLSGLPGSGKSTLARAYAAKFGAIHVNSDLLRGELGLRGQYQPGDKERVYQAMLEKTRNSLRAGDADVIVDSTFYREAIREPFEHIAKEFGIPAFWVEVKASEETIRQRLKTPRPDSEADFNVFKKIRDQFEPWQQPTLILWSDERSLEELTYDLYQYTHPNHDG